MPCTSTKTSETRLSRPCRSFFGIKFHRVEKNKKQTKQFNVLSEVTIFVGNECCLCLVSIQTGVTSASLQFKPGFLKFLTMVTKQRG